MDALSCVNVNVHSCGVDVDALADGGGFSSINADVGIVTSIVIHCIASTAITTFTCCPINLA